MRHKLETPWTSRLAVTRWWYRRQSPFTSYTASSQGSICRHVHVRVQPPRADSPSGRH